MLTHKPPALSLIERKRMKNNMQMALAQKAEEETKTGKTQKEMEKQLEDQKQIKKVVNKDMLTQKEMFQKRLAERKKNQKERANSVSHGGLNNTLPLDQIDS